MPFRLTNAAATFQQALDIILTRFKWNTYLVYMDDTIIFSKHMDDHMQVVDNILKTPGEAFVTLDLNKVDSSALPSTISVTFLNR